MPGGASSPASASPLVNLGWAQAPLLDSQFRTDVGGRQDGRRSTGPRPAPEAPGKVSILASLGDLRWQRRGWRTGRGKGDRLAGALPPVRPPRAGSVQKRDADCENRREGVGSFPSLIIASACSFLHPHCVVPTAVQTRTRVHAKV